jgi:two-component system phosphate regulon sensor histidine kinase PhoR
MWIALTIFLAVALLALNERWRRRCRRLQETSTAQQEKLDVLAHEFEHGIAHQKAQLEVFFDSMVEGVLVLDSRQTVRRINPALHQIFQIHGDVKGLSLMEVLRRHELLDLVRRVEREGKSAGIDLEWEIPQPRYLRANAIPFHDPVENSNDVIIVFHDLTRVKQLETIRQDFVANVSHELRTPLSMIKGYVETLQDGAKNDPVSLTRFLDIIQKHADRLAFLIEDLLTLSRLDSGRMQLSFQNLDLRGEVERVVHDLADRAAQRKVTLLNTLPPGILVKADPERLSQILVNLLDNAIKYGRAEGRVEVGGGSVKDGLMELFVRDNGPGIPVESIDRVFERFYRVDRARSRDQGGTGLGLAIVKHLVQSHGGKVWLESEPGKGCCFHFTLPRAAAAEAPASPASS